MSSSDPVADNCPSSRINDCVIGLSPSVSLGSNMLALAGAMARDYSSAANQQQLNAMMAMVAAMQFIGGGTSSSIARADTDAMDLLKQVIANVQAN